MPACPDQLPLSFDAASAGIQAANLIRSASAILNFAALSYPGDSPERTRLLHYALKSQRLARAITRTKARSSEPAQELHRLCAFKEFRKENP
jgi:hypothetical protein